VTEREYRLVNENNELRAKLFAAQRALSRSRACLRNWKLRQQAWHRERDALDAIVAYLTTNGDDLLPHIRPEQERRSPTRA